MEPTRILLVDGELARARATALELHAAGHHVLVATSAIQAIRRIASEAIDAIVIDDEVAGVDTLHVAEFARFKSARLPVVVATPCRPTAPARLDPAPMTIPAPPATLDILAVLERCT